MMLLTLFALIAFAANSVLCRMALGDAAIDAASFSSVRLASGAAMLLFISIVSRKDRSPGRRKNWISAAMLFLYAVPFSFAYISLSTGTGALILFGSVQATMILAALLSGEHPHTIEWIGLLTALGGLVYLVFPGLSAPSISGSLLMTVAGISWGFYTLLGRNALDPLSDTTYNFIRSLPFVFAVSVVMSKEIHLTPNGMILAVLSGALASGLGYVVWYAALKGLTTTRAATVQLSVPVIAALGGVVFMSESITVRLFVSAILILGGVGLAIVGREHFVREPNHPYQKR
jgi:drug/metabolite transporter (DMT)-like permease